MSWTTPMTSSLWQRRYESIILTDPNSLLTRSRDWWPLLRLLEASGVASILR